MVMDSSIHTEIWRWLNHLRCNYEALFCNGEICHINGKLIWNPRKESWSNGILCHVDVLAENWSTDLQILTRSNLSTSGRFLYFKRKPKKQLTNKNYHGSTQSPIYQFHKWDSDPFTVRWSRDHRRPRALVCLGSSWELEGPTTKLATTKNLTKQKGYWLFV